MPGKSFGSVVHADSDAQFNKAMSDAGGALVVQDWFATWCGPCRAIAPVVEAAAKAHPSVLFLKVDVDKADGAARDAGIRAMPTFRFLVNGKVLETFSGADQGRLQVHQQQGGLGEHSSLTDMTCSARAASKSTRPRAALWEAARCLWVPLATHTSHQC